MEPVFLKHIINNQPSEGYDKDSPFSFLEWKERLPSLLEKDAIDHYNKYVIDWFNRNKQTPVSRTFVLRQKYLYMLDQLQLFFDSDEKNNWYRQVNLADEKELLLAIPYFAKKLKDIALYYLNLRNQLKRTKTQYNSVGSVGGIEQEVYRYLLTTFSDKNNELSPTLQKAIPALSALQKNLTIQIEELYDDKQYFDVSPTKPLTDYFDLLNETTSKFLATKGIVLSSSDWLFESFDVSMTPDNFDTAISRLTGVLFETTDTELYNSFVQKYISENKFVLTTFPQNSATSEVTVFISEGNNNFYYPYGTNSSTFSIKQELPIISLSSLYIKGATPGSSPQDSDTLIIKYGDTTKAAWLRYIDYENSFKRVKTTLGKDKKTSFIYPFPGYGLSGTNLPWTGVSLETDPEYNFLSVENKASVNQAYWSQPISKDTCDTILLNNTSLISSGANAHPDPRFADQIYLKRAEDRNVDPTVPQLNPQGAWLYKITKTALPVSPVQDNVFLWPYTRINTEEDFPSHLKQIDLYGACTPISIHNLNKNQFVAGSNIETADKIYKLAAASDAIENALECSWLSGSVVKLTNYPDSEYDKYRDLRIGINLLRDSKTPINGYSFTTQDSFNALFPAGEATRFIWTGPKTELDDVFGHRIFGTSFTGPNTGGILHRADCPFTTNVPAVSAFEWSKCTCKQVYYAPFGHNFRTYAEGNFIADAVIKVPDIELTPFDYGSWRDSLGNPLSGVQVNGTGQAGEFAWYKTEKTKKNFDWGGGAWRSDANLGGSPFSLYPGKSYIYIRANNKTGEETLPPFIANFNYQTTTNTKWVEAKLDKQGNWISSDESSRMYLYPGNYIKIERQTQTTCALLSARYIQAFPENKNTIWSTYDTIPIGCGTNYGTVISWPNEPKPFGYTGRQYPSTLAMGLSYIDAWAIRKDNRAIPAQSEIQFIHGFDAITFVPILTSTGTYSIAVTATRVDGTKTFASSPAETNFPSLIPATLFDQNGNPYTPIIEAYIPKITAVNEFEKFDYVTQDIITPTAGFLLEQDLTGWNYSTQRPNPRTIGARPYWALLDVEKNATTRYKGIYSWGYPYKYLDDYIPDNNPIISPLEINFGTIIDYYRKGYSFVWNQPIVYKSFADKTQWCLLSAVFTATSNLSNFYEIRQKIDPYAAPSYNPSDIYLSNVINGAPVEIFYYANNPFIWTTQYTIATEPTLPTLSSYFISKAPWENMTNRFYPTIANVPVAEELYTVENVGGYFLPQHLGASQFVNKNFDIFLRDSNLSGTFLTESINVHIGGRGRTKEDNVSIFEWTENNEWLKESPTTGNLAGATKKELTKTLQTFVPYQSNVDETALGLVTTRSKFTPWGGPNGDLWTDKNNDKQSFTGVKNVSAWVQSQILKQNEKSVDRWCSDIYGNQYGLFKNLKDIPLEEHVHVYGELWIRTNKQVVDSATNLLSAAYLPFIGINYDTYNSLTQNKIQIIDCYFDTLFIKTPNIIIFAEITYNYDTGNIEMVFDDVRWNTLNANFIYHKNWFLPEQKKLYVLCSAVVSNNYFPQIFELDLSNRKYKKVFELNTNVSLPVFATTPTCCLHFNKNLNTFLITYAGQDFNAKLNVLDFYVKSGETFELIDTNWYKDQFDSTQIQEPPIITSQYLSCFNVGTYNFSISVSGLNFPTSYEIINSAPLLSGVSVRLLDGYGVFSGTVPAGMHHINYKVKNSIGESIYSLTLSAFNDRATYLKVQLSAEDGSTYGNTNDGAISITCYGSLTSYNITFDQTTYIVPVNNKLIIKNLDSRTYKFAVTDEWFGTRYLNFTVGYKGSVALSSVDVPNQLEGQELNTIFEI